MKKLFLMLLLGAYAANATAQEQIEQTSPNDILFANSPKGCFSFMIAGDSVTLPCAWEELERIGWRFEDSQDAQRAVEPLRHHTLLHLAPKVTVHTPAGRLCLTFTNPTTEELPMSGCVVFALQTETTDPAESFLDFTLPGGVRGGQTTGGQMEALYGYPHSTLGIGFESGRKWVQDYSSTDMQSGAEVNIHQQQTEPEQAGLVIGFDCTTEAEIARRIASNPNRYDDDEANKVLCAGVLNEGIERGKQLLKQDSLSQEERAGAAYQIGFGYYQLEEMQEALRWFLKAAEQGNTEAQYAAGYYYNNGIGTEQNPATAVKWYTKAAEQGNTEAMNNLAHCYEQGKGVESDPLLAFEWFERAAEAGNATAMCNLAYYYLGEKGIPADDDKLFEWATKAAEELNEEAYVVVGYCYHYGKGVKRNYIQAVRWYRDGAAEGDKMAAYNLATMFYYGYGVDRDYDRALELFLQAEGATPQVQAALGECYYRGYGTQKDLTQAARHYRAFLEQFDASDKLGKDEQKIYRQISKLLRTKLKDVKGSNNEYNQ